MSDEIAAVTSGSVELPALPAPRKAVDIHPKVALPILAGSVLNIIMGVAKANGLDLSGYEADLTILVMGAIGYYVPST